MLDRNSCPRCGFAGIVIDNRPIDPDETDYDDLIAAGKTITARCICTACGVKGPKAFEAEQLPEGSRVAVERWNDWTNQQPVGDNG